MLNISLLGMTLNVLLEIAALLVIPPLLVFGALYADLRSRHGYGLVALSLALIGLVIWAATTFAESQRNARFDLLGSGIAIALLLSTGLYLTLALGIGALIEARAARQGSWLIGLLVAVLVPWLAVLIPVLAHQPLPSLPATFGLTPDALIILTLLLPPLAVLAYGLSRIWRPAEPATPRCESVPAR